MPTSRYDLAGAVVNGKIYAIGGYNGTVRDNVEVYDSRADTWTTVASMPTKRQGLTAAVVDSVIYAIGGYNTGSELGTVEAYNPATDSWSTRASMPTPRHWISSAVMGGTIYVVGGYNGSTLKTVEAYDPATDSWMTKASLPSPTRSIVAGVINGKLYTIAGNDGTTVFEYDRDMDTWTTKSSQASWNYPSGTVVNGQIYVLGACCTVANVAAYDPAANVWLTKTSMPTARYTIAVGVVGNVIYAIGGRDNPSAAGMTVVEAGTLVLSAGMDMSPRPVPMGTSLQVVLTVTNSGAGQVTGLSPSLSVVSGASLVGLSTGPVPPTVASLSPGAAATFTWTFNAYAAGMVTLSATVTGTDADTGGPVVGMACTSGTVEEEAHLEAALALSSPSASVGQWVKVMLTVTNTGGTNANGVMPALQINAGAGLVAAQGTVTPAGPVTLVPGGVQDFTWTYSVSGGGLVGFTATAAGTDAGNGNAVLGSADGSLTCQRPAGNPGRPMPPTPDAVSMYVYPHPLKCPGGNAVFQMPQSGTATLRILNMRGQVVKEISAELAASPRAEVFIDCRDAKNGAYLIQGELAFTDGTSRRLKPYKFVVAGNR